MNHCIGAGRGPRVWLAAFLVAAAAGCFEQSKPFCRSWLVSPEPEREDLVGEAVRDWLENSRGSSSSNLNFVRCVGREVLARSGAITEACKLYGDLEAGVVIGGLVSSGVQRCLDLRQLRRAPD